MMHGLTNLKKMHCWLCSVRRRNTTMPPQHRKRTGSPHCRCWHRNNFVSNVCKCQAVPPHAQPTQRALPRFEAGARKLWVISTTLRSLYHWEKGLVPTVQEAGWFSETFWMVLVKNLSFTGVRTPGHSPSSDSPQELH